MQQGPSLGRPLFEALNQQFLRSAMYVANRLVDARCAEVLPQTTARSEPQPLEPLGFESETNLHDLVARAEARQASSRIKIRRSKNESTRGDQFVRMRHCSVNVHVDRGKVASFHHRGYLRRAMA